MIIKLDFVLSSEQTRTKAFIRNAKEIDREKERERNRGGGRDKRERERDVRDIKRESERERH